MTGVIIKVLQKYDFYIKLAIIFDIKSKRLVMIKFLIKINDYAY